MPNLHGYVHDENPNSALLNHGMSYLLILSIERVLRYLASTNMITEVGVNEYQANKITHILADPKGEGMAYYG